MSAVLGVLDAIESMISEGKKVPFSDKIILDEKKLYALVDKLRYLIKADNENAARQAVESKQDENQQPVISAESLDTQIIEAVNKAKEIEIGANEYADNILAHLQLLITKMQKNLIRLEKNVDDGRMVLDEKQRSLKDAKKEELEDEKRQPQLG